MSQKVFVLIILLLFGCSTASPVKLVGKVQSSKTDESDNPVEIYLWDGKVGYPIVKNEQSEVLLEKVDSDIEVKGELNEGWSGEKTLVINSFRIIRDASE